MEFEYNEQTYRVARGGGTQNWLLLKLLPGSTTGWRLTKYSFPAFVDEADIIDHAKNSLASGVDPELDVQ